MQHDILKFRLVEGNTFYVSVFIIHVGKNEKMLDTIIFLRKEYLNFTERNFRKVTYFVFSPFCYLKIKINKFNTENFIDNL